MRNKKSDNKKLVNRKTNESEERNRQFETPSQQRNRDGVGRGPSGSDGGSTKGRGSNH